MKANSLISVACTLALSAAAHAGSELPVSLANKQGFTGCDALIDKVFQLSPSAGDQRVNTSYFDETRTDSIKLTSTSGKPGDSMFVEAEFRKVGGKCFSTATVIVPSSSSCAVITQENPLFKFKYQVGDFVWAENPGKINQYKRSIGSGCMVVYQLNQASDAAPAN